MKQLSSGSRLLASLIALLLVCAPLWAGGGAEEAADPAEETVELLGYGVRYHFGMSEPFMPGYYYWPEHLPNYDIEYNEATPADMMQAIVEGIPAGVWPDFYFVRAQDIRRAIALGHISPLDDFASQYPEVFDRYTDGSLEHYAVDGSIYALPYTVKPHAFYLNTDIFDALGVDLPDEDWTWPELVELAQQLTDKPDYSGWELGPNAWYLLYSMLVSYDAQMYTEDNGTRVSNLAEDDAAIEAIELFLDLTSNLGLQFTDEEQEEHGIGNAFNEGRIAMRFASTWTQTWGSFDRDAGEYRFNTAVVRAPTGPGGRGVFPDGYGVALHPAGNREAGFEVASHVTSEEWGDYAVQMSRENDEIDLTTIWNLYYEGDPVLRDGLPPWRGADERAVNPISEHDYLGFLEARQDVHIYDFDFLTYFDDDDDGLSTYLVAVADGDMELIDALREFDDWATSNVLND